MRSVRLSHFRRRLRGSRLMHAITNKATKMANGKKLCGRTTVDCSLEYKAKQCQMVSSIFHSKNLLTSQFSLVARVRICCVPFSLISFVHNNFYALFGTHLPHEQLNEWHARVSGQQTMRKLFAKDIILHAKMCQQMNGIYFSRDNWICGGRRPLKTIHGGVTTMWVKPLQVFNQHFDRYNESATLTHQVRRHSSRRDRCYVIRKLYMPFSMLMMADGICTLCRTLHRHRHIIIRRYLI